MFFYVWILCLFIYMETMKIMNRIYVNLKSFGFHVNSCITLKILALLYIIVPINRFSWLCPDWYITVILGNLAKFIFRLVYVITAKWNLSHDYSLSKSIAQTSASIKLIEVQSSILLHGQKCSIDNKQRWLFW